MTSVLAKYVHQGAGFYRKVAGGDEFAPTFTRGMFHTGADAATDLRTLMTRAQPSPPMPPRPVVRIEELGYARAAALKTTDPKRYRALLDDSQFRREAGLSGLTDDQCLAALNRRKRPDLVEQYLSLREALRR
jgi:hypothetical protein